MIMIMRMIVRMMMMMHRYPSPQEQDGQLTPLLLMPMFSPLGIYLRGERGRGRMATLQYMRSTTRCGSLHGNSCKKTDKSVSVQFMKK